MSQKIQELFSKIKNNSSSRTRTQKTAEKPRPTQQIFKKFLDPNSAEAPAAPEGKLTFLNFHASLVLKTSIQTL